MGFKLEFEQKLEEKKYKNQCFTSLVQLLEFCKVFYDKQL